MSKKKIDTSILSNDVHGKAMDDLAAKIVQAGTHGNKSDMDAWMKDFALFSSTEKQQFLDILEEYRKSGYSTALRDMWQLDYERQPVKFDEWLENPYYMGKLGEELYPLWQEELKYILHPNSGIIEWGLTGAIGIGKTYCALIAMLYKGAYLCSCLKNPQSYFGLAENSEIVFGLFNIQLDRATEVNFKQVGRFIRGSRYFQEHCPAVVTPSKGKIYWPARDMILTIGSSEFHVLGSNMFSYTMDEANFMKVTEANKDDQEQQQAYKIYNNASRRMKSRFEQYGMNPGLAIIASSRLHQSSFLEDLMEKRRDDPSFHVSDYALWDTKGRHRYSPGTFRVTIGNELRKSEILDTVDTTNRDKMKWAAKPEEAKEVPQGVDYLNVPCSFYYDFTSDIDGSLRDLAGVPTFGSSPLIWRVESVTECIDHSRSHPFLREWHELSMDDPEADLLGVVKWEELTKIKGGTRVPIYHPEQPRFVHCDLGLTGDAAGIAMVCPYGQTMKTEYDPYSGQVKESFRPKIWVDFMLQIKPVRGEQIDLTKIVAFVLNLRNYGFNLQRATFDGFASEMAIQIIRKASTVPEKRRIKRGFDDKLDIESSVLSVDKTDTPYRVLRDLLNTGSISYYDYPIFKREVLKLDHDTEKKKVDHLPNETKDVSDAVCGAAFGVVTARVPAPSNPVDVRGQHRPTVEDEAMAAITADYSDKHRVTELIPAPKSPSKPRQLRSGRSGWQKQIENFGKYNKRG